jgi:hypothetical protein
LTTLANATVGTQPPDDGLRIGIVETINPLTVNITGGLIPAGIQGSYIPAVGDNVSVIRQDGTWLITGRVGGPDMAFPTAVAIRSDKVTQGPISSVTPAYVDITGTAGSISKASGTSVLQVLLSGMAFAGATNTEVTYTLNLVPVGGSGAGITTVVTTVWFSTTGHTPFSATRWITGIPAGDYTFTFQWAVSASTISRNAADIFQAILEER